MGAFLWMIACKMGVKSKAGKNFFEYRAVGICGQFNS